MKTINHHLICPFQRHRCCAFLISSLSIGKTTQRMFAELTNPIGGSAFDSPGLANDSAGYPGLAYGLWGTTPSVLRFFNFIFSKGRGDAGRPCLQDSYMHPRTHTSEHKRASTRRCGMMPINKKGIWLNRQMPFFFLCSSYPVD